MKNRPQEITQDFIRILEHHLDDIISGKTEDYLQISDLAEKLHIHPTHLSNTIKETTNMSPCEICHEKTIERAKVLLQNEALTIRAVAQMLTYDPSNFTKYFKNRTVLTPTAYRKIISDRKFGNYHHNLG